MKKIITALSILFLGYCAGLMSYSFWFAESLNQQDIRKSALPEVGRHTNASLTRSAQKNKAFSNNQKERHAPHSTLQKASSDEIKQALKELTTSIDIGKAYFLLNQASEQEILQLLEELTSQKEEIEPSTISLLVAVLAEKNLQSGVEYLEQNLLSLPDSNFYIRAVLKVWADKKPLDSLNWYQQNKDNFSNAEGFFEGVPLLEVFDGLAKHDLQTAISSLEQLALSDKEMQFSLMGVAKNIEDLEDFESLYRFAENLPNKRMRDTVISRWTEKNPRQAADWATAMEQSTQDEYYSERVFRSWVFSGEVNEAADWYMAQGDQESRQKRAKLVVENWGYRNPQAAMDWIGAQEYLDQNESLVSLFDVVVHSSPEFVLSNIESLENDTNKVETLFNLYMSLKMNNELRAQNMVADSDYREALEARIREYEEQNKD